MLRGSTRNWPSRASSVVIIIIIIAATVILVIATIALPGCVLHSFFTRADGPRPAIR
jgi:hypothetical protein